MTAMHVENFSINTGPPVYILYLLNQYILMACVTDSNCDLHFKSLDRVQNYPIVNDSFVLALSYYQWLKSKNAILDGTLSRAESTLKSVKDTAEPIAVRNLGFIDNVVYNQLDRLEKSCPVILEPSRVIANIPSKIYHDNFESTFKTVMWPATKTIDVVSKTSNMAMSSVSSVVDASIKRVFTSTNLPTVATNYLLDKSDELLDKYLPATDEPMDELIENSDIYAKAKRLSAKTRRRVIRKAVKQINSLQKSSMEKLDQIQLVIAEIQKKKDALIYSCSDAVESIKDNISITLSKHSDIIKDALHYSKSLRKLVSISSATTIEFVSKQSVNILTVINENLLKLQTLLSESKPEFINDNILIHTKNAINQIQKSLDSFISNLKEHAKQSLSEEMIEMTDLDTDDSVDSRDSLCNDDHEE